MFFPLPEKSAYCAVLLPMKALMFGMLMSIALTSLFLMCITWLGSNYSVVCIWLPLGGSYWVFSFFSQLSSMFRSTIVEHSGDQLYIVIF